MDDARRAADTVYSLVKSSLTKRKRNGTCCHLNKYENISLWLLECNRSSPFQIYCVPRRRHNGFKRRRYCITMSNTIES